MSIESTHYVNRRDAIQMLYDKGADFNEDMSNEKLSEILYWVSREDNNEEYIFENYIVVDWTKWNEPEFDKWELWRSSW